MLSLFILTLGLSRAGADLGCQARLAPGLVHDLRKAVAGGGFSADVFTRGAGRSREVIVLVGESHVKSKRDAALGRRLLTWIPHVGVEGRPWWSTWGGLIAENTLAPLRRSLGIKPPLPYHRLRRPGATDPRAITEGSTITEAERLDFRRRYHERIRGESTNLSRMRLRLLRAGNEIILEADGLVFMTRAEAVALVSARLAREPLGEWPTTVTHNLEVGHDVGWLENIETLRLERLLPALLLPAGGHSLDALVAGAIAVAAGTVYFRGGQRYLDLNFHHYHDPLVKALLPLHGAMVHGRDATMARNLDRLAAEHGELLGIVGRAHVVGMTRHLAAAGFARHQIVAR